MIDLAELMDQGHVFIDCTVYDKISLDSPDTNAYGFEAFLCLERDDSDSQTIHKNADSLLDRGT